MAVDITQISFVYDSLEAKIKTTLDEQWNNGRLTGSDYAQVLSSTLVQAMQLAVQSVQNQPEIDAKVFLEEAQKSELLLNGVKDRLLKDEQIAEIVKKIDVEERQTVIAEAQSAKDLEVKDIQIATEQKQQAFIDKQVEELSKKIDVEERQTVIAEAQSAKDLEVKDERKIQTIAQTYLINAQKDNAIKQGLQLDENLSLLSDEHPYKVQLVQKQVDKLIADKNYVDEQKTQLTNSVIYNNKIKALDSLANTYGTFGAGGLTMSKDMWSAYFNIISSLTGTSAPSDTTVSKVS